MDSELLIFFAVVLVFLVLGSAAGWILRRRVKEGPGQAMVENLVARVNAWWWMVAVLAAAILSGKTGALIFYGFVSFLALREYITLTPSNRGDHRALFWIFFLVIPIQYFLLAIAWYGLALIFIPVYAWVFVAARSALAGDCTAFLERTAKIQWGLMVCVYFLSYAPALLLLTIPKYEGQNAKLLVYLVFVSQISDVMQYIWGKLMGKHPVAPSVSPNKTVEGLVGGGLSAILFGTALWWMTPFNPWQAACMSAVIVGMGFLGGLIMSAVKRDRGVKDYGATIAGHGGILDRIDSLCFAAPIFFHLTRFFYSTGGEEAVGPIFPVGG